MRSLKLFAPLLLIFAISNISCSVYQTIVNISRLKFKLGVVNNFTLSGINLTTKKSVNDFGSMELLKLAASFANGSMPATFTLNVNANNPNDGSGGYAQTNATIVSFPWRLMVNDKETVTGDIGSPFSVPGTGQDAVIPLQITFDLYKIVQSKNYQDILNLALSLGGYGGSNSTNLALYAKPVVSSPIGNISYPQELKIISYDYTK